MLARALPGVAVVVGESRYDAGRLAESELGATVHVLDDGFQHLQVARDVDLLLLSEEDLSDRPLSGRPPQGAAHSRGRAARSDGRGCERLPEAAARKQPNALKSSSDSSRRSTSRASCRC